LSATSQLGTAFVVQGSTDIHPTGLSAIGEVGRVLVWQDVNPSQNPNWINLSPSQTPTWVNIP